MGYFVILRQTENFNLMKQLLLTLALAPFVGFSQMVDTGADVQFEPRSNSLAAIESGSKSTTYFAANFRLHWGRFNHWGYRSWLAQCF